MSDLPNSSDSIDTTIKVTEDEIASDRSLNDHAPLWSISCPKKRKGMSGLLEKALNISAREQLDGEIARIFYTGERKDKFLISNLLIDAIREIGLEKVVHAVTDNASVLKSA
ncbi:hypothetical protein Q3G72_022764 [Acer saccharum]|nr:hypothetical protein Q3G72_022764 [Acer saccharum]